MTAVMEWLAYWAPFVGVAAVWVFAVWLAGVRRRRMEAQSRECPMCHGSGRVDREVRS